uniref:WRKY19-like zinc finger domain-containing protein n=1 Tax=Globisporangium ultimum (strain ATCC 200006 / CBS 805.95 / DAOM BR144) TaxID=431595 RepID=K3WGA0_GLOUD
MDVANFEPLDDNSLEFLVSSLTHINSELNQYSEEDEDEAGDYRYGTESKFGRQQQQTPDVSESFSDSSASSMSPHGSPYDRYPISSLQQRSQLQAATTPRGSLGQAVTKKKPKRIRRLCIQPNCGKRARSQGLCIAHGGGRRCIVEGCEKSSQGGNMCIKHGGGKRCRAQGCNKAAQTHSLCKAHGGGPRCQVEGCDKSSQGGGFCRSHGGGKRCAAEGCDKGTQRGDFCALHGGSRFCEVSGCRRNDRGGGLCAHHGGGKRCGILNCTRPCRRNGFCSTHLRLLGRDGEAGDSSDEMKSWV